jgi:hypothetical protein
MVKMAVGFGYGRNILERSEHMALQRIVELNDTNILDDPVIQAEYDAITDAEDREDYLEMVQVFQQTEDGGYTTLDAVKSELGA